MKKILSLSMIGLFALISVKAQVTLGRKVFANGGTSTNIGTTNYNYTIGEAVIGTKTGTYPQLTIGFQQPIHNSLLPVSLLEFQVNQKGNDGDITWNTIWEVNSKAFVVERSIDNIHFQAIGQLAGAGESMEPRSYQWIDPGIVFLGANVFYYRLRELHLDGGYSFSQTEELRIIRPDQNVICYPNPAQHQLTLQFTENPEMITEVSFWNPLGQEIRRSSSPQLNTNNQLTLEVSDLPRGSYILRVNQAGKLYVFRVLLI